MLGGGVEEGTARRRAVYVAGLGHGDQPIPVASRIDNLVWSGGIRGFDVQTQTMVPDVDGQVALMFQNMRAAVAASGGTVDDIIRVSVTARDRSAVRDALNVGWLEAFPDPASRPARHVAVADLPDGTFVQCEFIAVLGPSQP